MQTCAVLRKSAVAGVGAEQGRYSALAGQADRADPDAAGAGRADGWGRGGMMIGDRIEVREIDPPALFQGTPLQELPFTLSPNPLLRDMGWCVFSVTAAATFFPKGS